MAANVPFHLSKSYIANVEFLLDVNLELGVISK
jgi:hypothetical protein